MSMGTIMVTGTTTVMDITMGITTAMEAVRMAWPLPLPSR